MTGATDRNAVEARGIVKSFGDHKVLDGVDLVVPQGTVLGLLGPNGAGKTTMVRILTTLLDMDGGTATVAGHDLATEQEQIRRSIGLSGQYAAVDGTLTGFENLYLVGRLYGFSRARSRERARELLARFRLEGAARRQAKTYSGGMRRRLDLAGALVAAPSVVVLDEPTTGLDPRSRQDTWDMVRELVDDGTSALLTTQYLEEADLLADNITVLDHGKVVAEGTADELKAHVGNERLEVVVTRPADVPALVAVLTEVGSAEPVVDERLRRGHVLVYEGIKALTEALKRLDAQDVAVLDAALHRPKLDDVFFMLTERKPEETADAEVSEPEPRKRRFRRRGKEQP